MQEFFQVVIADKNRAVEAVRVAAQVANGTLVEVVGQLSPIEIRWIGLQPGEVRSIRKTIAGSERQGRGIGDSGAQRVAVLAPAAACF